MKKYLVIITIAMVVNALVPFIVTYTAAGYRINLERPACVEQSAILHNSTSGIEGILSNSAQISIPEDYGSIIKAWTPEIPKDNRPLIIYIQDAHCNYDVQKNISCLIDDIMEKYPGQLSLVAVEGSSGTIDTSIFESFGDEVIKSRVSDYFMKEGKITGPEFLSITGSYDFTLYGIEDKGLYNENYKTFLDSLPFRNKSSAYFKYTWGVMARLKEQLYSDNLKEFDKHLKDYQDGNIGFPDYINILRDFAEKQDIDLTRFKNVMLLFRLYQIEDGIDFSMVQSERDQLINKLGNTLDKEELSALMLKSLEFSRGRLAAVRYYSYLKNLAEKDYPNLFSYSEYLQIHENMDRDALLSECSEIEDLIIESMFENDDQYKLSMLSKNLNILYKMLRLELTKEEYIYYRGHKGNFSALGFHKRIKVLASRYGIRYSRWPELSEIDRNLAVAEEFYEMAIKREPVLINNMLKQMETQGVNVCVLITGGFHTEGISKILKEKDIAYVVISPKINEKQEYNPYIDVMKDRRVAINKDSL